MEIFLIIILLILAIPLANLLRVGKWLFIAIVAVPFAMLFWYGVGCFVYHAYIAPENYATPAHHRHAPTIDDTFLVPQTDRNHRSDIEKALQHIDEERDSSSIGHAAECELYMAKLTKIAEMCEDDVNCSKVYRRTIRDASRRN